MLHVFLPASSYLAGARVFLLTFALNLVCWLSWRCLSGVIFAGKHISQRGCNPSRDIYIFTPKTWERTWAFTGLHKKILRNKRSRVSGIIDNRFGVLWMDFRMEGKHLRMVFWQGHRPNGFADGRVVNSQLKRCRQWITALYFVQDCDDQSDDL